MPPGGERKTRMRTLQTEQLHVCTPKKKKNYLLPIHWDVEHISRAHDRFIADNIFKIWEPIIVGVVKIHLEMTKEQHLALRYRAILVKWLPVTVLHICMLLHLFKGQHRRNYILLQQCQFTVPLATKVSSP